MRNYSERSKTIIQCSLFGIILNVILIIFKVILAVAIRSQAILLDAANGLADMFSAGVTIVSSVTSEKQADRRHPFGYGRLEYLFSFFLTLVILFMGGRGLVRSIQDILYNNYEPDYSISAAVLMAVSFVVKLTYGLRAKRIGKKTKSITLTLSGIESMHDSLISVVILAAMLIYRLTGVILEHWISIVFAIMLIKDGIELAVDSMNRILGTRIDPEYIRRIKQLIVSEEGVYHVSNLVIHNYGEEHSVGSVDIEVDEDMKASEISRLSRSIIRKVKEQGLLLTSVGIIGNNTADPRAAKIFDTVIDLARKDPDILRVQGFSADLNEKLICFSIVLNPRRKKDSSSREEICKAVRAAFPDMQVEVDTALDI